MIFKKRRVHFSLPRADRPSRRGRKIAAGLGIFFAILAIWLAIALGPMRFLFFDVPGLAGFPLSERYLILLQNNAEIRPTGGFLTAVGELRMNLGLPTKFKIENTYNLDARRETAPPAPEPITARFGDDPGFRGWELRDANWDPDFPEAARTVERFFAEAGGGKNFDQIIAIDRTFLEKILAATGPVRVAGREFSAENLFFEMTRAVTDFDAHDEAGHENRKNILGDLGGAILKKIALRPWLWDDAFRAVAESADEKHFLWLSRDGDLAGEIAARGWDGALRPDPGADFLQINIANLGGRKSDRYLRRSARLVVTRNANGDLVHGLTIALRHDGPKNFISNDFTGWARVIVPGGSKILETAGNLGAAPRSEKIGDLTAFSFPVGMAPGTEARIFLSYQIPEKLVEKMSPDSAPPENPAPGGASGTGGYALVWRGQPGETDPLREVVFRAPDGAALRSEIFETREERAFWRDDQPGDRRLDLAILPDRSPPLLVEQKFTGPKDFSKILLIFNEPLDPTSIATENFQIRDADRVDPGTTDAAEVIGAGYFDRGVTLRIRGVEPQPEERYALEIHGIRDANGVEMPARTATVVQRILD